MSERSTPVRYREAEVWPVARDGPAGQDLDHVRVTRDFKDLTAMPSLLMNYIATAILETEREEQVLEVGSIRTTFDGQRFDLRRLLVSQVG